MDYKSTKSLPVPMYIGSGQIRGKYRTMATDSIAITGDPIITPVVKCAFFSKLAAASCDPIKSFA